MDPQKYDNKNIEPRGDGNSVRKIRMQKHDYTNSPMITNQKAKVLASECISPADDEFQLCMLYDEYGVSRKVPQISFISYEVRDPFITSYKAQNGVVVNRVDFAEPEWCKIMGHNKNGLTLECGGFFDERKRTGGKDDNGH